MTRASGILLHPTSLPGRYGIGDLGPHAFAFADFLHAAGQTIWQMLPLGPAGYGDSPYQLFSAFAGNPLLISPEKLLQEGMLAPADLASAPSFPESYVEFGDVIDWKSRILQRAYENFSSSGSSAHRSDYEAFCEAQAAWLDPYARFMALKHIHGMGISWTEWQQVPADPEPFKYQQFEFFRQWNELKNYCRDRGIRLMGDMPIYVAHDSADVWAHPELFNLDSAGNSLAVAGVPPDYFSATGQLWGNPTYRWDAMERTGFQWWIARFKAAFAQFDLIRVDHFRGFEAYWEVDASEATAVNGRWVKGPGADLFVALERELGHLPIVAENLGVITPEVEAIRERFKFPGMSILQFAFGTDPQAPTFRPHNYVRESFVYTGTHDNDTAIGWWRSGGTGDSTRSAEDVAKEKQFALEYLASDGVEMNWTMIRTLLASVADTAIFPLQDVLGLGSEARMNTPGKPAGNWRWRFPGGALTPELTNRLMRMTSMYERTLS